MEVRGRTCGAAWKRHALTSFALVGLAGTPVLAQAPPARPGPAAFAPPAWAFPRVAATAKAAPADALGANEAAGAWVAGDTLTISADGNALVFHRA